MYVLLSASWRLNLWFSPPLQLQLMSETSQEHDEIVSADDVKPIKAGNRDPKWLDLSPLIKYKCQL